MLNIKELEEKIKILDLDINKQKKKSNLLSILRLILSIVIIAIIIKSFSNGISFLEGIPIVLGIALFIVLVVFHTKVKKQEKYLSIKIKIINEYIDRLNYNWRDFKDIGEEAIDYNHCYTGDLDIFGKGSLFQLINATKTFVGRQRLIKTLSGDFNIKKLKEKQEAVKELSNNIDFCIEVQTKGEVNLDKNKDPKDLIDYGKNLELSYNKAFKWIIYPMPVILIISSFLAYITLSKVFLNIAAISLVINILLNAYFIVKGYSGFSKVTPYKKNLKAYLNIIDLIESNDFKSKYIKDIKFVLEDDIKASKVMKKLESIVDAINLRYNVVAYFILNLVFLWDYQCMFTLEDFKSKYGDKIEKYIYAVGDLEEIISLSVIDNINEITTYPNVKESGVYVKGEDIGHPLIKQDVRVNNDIDINEKNLVITGSNMSGKTTFLRTIGINLILAYSGAPCVAKSFSSSYMKVLTSMRIIDNLEMGISTFYAELIRIKNIIEYSKKNKPMIFLIDEIFRGTNSKDRIVGAKNVLKSLSKNHIIGGISTHDFEICDIKDEKIENYHFEEYYNSGKILFDYKIKNGISTTKNAKYLMRMVGIDIDE